MAAASLSSHTCLPCKAEQGNPEHQPNISSVSRLSLPAEQMLSWPAGPKPYDGVWAPWWYAGSHKSTGDQDVLYDTMLPPCASNFVSLIGNEIQQAGSIGFASCTAHAAAFPLLLITCQVALPHPLCRL